MITVICPYCEKPTELVGGDVIYPHRHDLYELKFWYCRPCEAYTGTHIHSKDHKPKGRVANARERVARMEAHYAFDPIWQSGAMTRKEAYEWLRQKLGVDYKVHIGFLHLKQLEQVVEVCQECWS